MSTPQSPAAESSPKRNIVLTGFMATGKSTVGRLLARRLRYDFVDTDQLIETRYGPITSIFEELGETRFREFERMIAIELARTHRTIIATGGGFMLAAENVEAFNEAHVLCLTADPDEIVRRITSGRRRRPLLDQGSNARDEVIRLLEDRRSEYAAFTQIDTTGLTADNVASLLAVTAATLEAQRSIQESQSRD